MRIDVAKVEYIEYSMGSSDIKKATDLTALVDFLNSFTLTKRYENIDCQRPSTDIIIYYKDGSTEHIVYRYTSLVYRGKGYEIDINKTDELDRLLFPQAWLAG